MSITKRFLKFGEKSAKNYILIVQEKQRACIGNNTEIILEMNLWQRKLEAQRLKVVKTQMKTN